MKSILFIHRSVGQNLLDDGGFALELKAAAKKANKSVDFADINNNYDHVVPGADTKPLDYLDYFSRTTLKEDLVMIKSCYPNNAIRSDSDLEQLKITYKKLVDAFLNHSKGRLLILTSPPLRPIRTSNGEARRARNLATWLEDKSFNERVRVFNFYDLLAEPAGSVDANTLKKKYRRLLPWDNHPKKNASQKISPMLGKAVVDFVK